MICKLSAIILLLAVIHQLEAHRPQGVRSSAFAFESPSNSAFSAVSSNNRPPNQNARLLICSLKLYSEISNFTNQTTARVRTELDEIQQTMLNEVSACAGGATSAQCANLKECFEDSADSGAIAQKVTSSLEDISEIPEELAVEIGTNFTNCLTAGASGSRQASGSSQWQALIGCLNNLLNQQAASVGPSLKAAIATQVQSVTDAITVNCFNPPPAPTTTTPSTGLPFREGFPHLVKSHVEVQLLRQAPPQPCVVSTVQACIAAQFAANNAAVGAAVQQWINQLVVSTVAGVSTCLQ